MGQNIIDLTGKRFGKLTVLNLERKERKVTPNNNHYKYYWKCKCDCGNETVINGEYLRRGSARDCGCTKLKDLTGKRFGKLVVLEFVEEKKRKKWNSYYWKCKCDCGNEVIRESESLRRGSTKSCGCLNNYKENLQKGIQYRENNILKEGTRLDHLNNKVSKANTTGVRGVTFDKQTNKYRATIEFKGEKYNLGRYTTLEKAAEARKKAEEKYYKPILEKYGYESRNNKESEEEFE